MKLPRLKKILLPIVLPLALLAGQAQAAYNLRYTVIAPGAMTFTGNAIGLNKQASNNNPGTSGAIGAYMAEGATTTYSGHPAPTTGDWRLNRSAAVLRIPAGATVLYAELVWGGSWSYGGEARTVAERNGNVNFYTPLGTNSVASDTLTRTDIGTAGSCTGTNTPCHYVRSANVTSIVQALGAGNHTISVGRIPATIGGSEANLNTGGWTLAVAYRDYTQPENKMNVYVGQSEFVRSGVTSIAPVTDFCTAPSGTQSGRLLVSAMEGDSGYTGDQFRFGATNPPPTTNNLGGTTNGVTANNPTNNFFASQINNDLGQLDTAGTFGSNNQTPGVWGQGRQGYDITNVPLDAFLAANQTTAYAQATTSQDTYVVNALGIQIKVGQPSFPTAVKTVNKTIAKVGEELLYTVTLDNSTGTASATNVKFFDTLPAGLTFVPGSFTSGGSPVAGADPTSGSGVTLANIATAAKLVVTFKAKVTSVPARPAPASYVNAARWTYDYIPCAGQPTISSEKITNSVTTTIARLDMAKTVSPTGTQNAGSTLTYTITMKNDGLAASSATTLLDTIPAGASYVAGSTKINGTAVADVAGAMPFTTAAAINSASQSAGVIAVGASATVEFKVTINGNATGNITNSATGDIDGSGTGTEVPFTTPPVSNTVQPVANVSITKTNGVSSVASGSSTSYTIQISNTGPSPANNTVVQDPVATGLNCTAVTCPAADLTGGAVCPASLDIPTLQGTGLTIPTLPANATIKLQVACTVTATGV